MEDGKQLGPIGEVEFAIKEENLDRKQDHIDKRSIEIGEKENQLRQQQERFQGHWF